MAEQRQRVVTELINTEKDYCSDLELCVKYFLFELQASQVSFFLISMFRVAWYGFLGYRNGRQLVSLPMITVWNTYRHIHPSY